MTRYVVFSHGKESGPWGVKILALAAVARDLGWAVESIDYQGMEDPSERVLKLLSVGADLGFAPTLVGSSMGGHVATAATVGLNAGGLFLMAPAFYMPGYESLTPRPNAARVEIAHGWRDDIVPVDHSIRWARTHRATLHLLDTDHQMQDCVEELSALFRRFLVAVGAPKG